MNLEDIGAAEQNLGEGKLEEQIKKQATVDKISHLINSYYQYNISDSDSIALRIFEVSENRDLDYHILLGIIKTESDFSNSKVSSTGDYSMAQINYGTWSDEFFRMKESKIPVADAKVFKQLQKIGPKNFSDQEKAKYITIVKKYDLLNYFELSSSKDYSIDKMGEILQILKKRHGKDKHWYARYHSGTCRSDFCPKMDYAKKVKTNIKHMDEVNKQYLQANIEQIQKGLAKAVDTHGLDQEKVQNLNQSLSKFMSLRYIAKN